MTTVDYGGLNAALDKAFPDRDWHNKCEAFRFQATRLTNDLASMRSFDSAKIALGNSKIIDKNRAAATVGQVGWWDKTIYGHDMLSLGNDIWIGATGLGDTIVDLGGGLKVLHGESYPATFLGRADNVGGNPKALLLPWSQPAPQPAPGGGAGWAANYPANDIQRRIQVAMAKRGRYKGKQNGLWGPLSIQGIQLTIRNVGYKGPIDGSFGPNTCHFVQVYAAKFGGYKGPINSILGPNGWLGFCRGLEAGLR